MIALAGGALGGVAAGCRRRPARAARAARARGGAGAGRRAAAGAAASSPRVALVNSSRVSEVALRNSRMPRPRPEPMSGSLPGPQMISTITSRMRMYPQ